MTITAATRRNRIWAWFLGCYAGGIALDFLYHLYLGQETGDRQISMSDLLVGFSASLFWPVDLLFRAVLATL
jgi:hypothetical protein